LNCPPVNPFSGKTARVTALAAVIDAQGYRLYGLTAAEIQIVEGAG
jgi:hypothetical protein